MRVLADENFPGDAVAALRQRGHDVVWVRTEMPGSGDDEVSRRAQRDRRTLVTFDKDFGELAFRFGMSAASGVILFRIRARRSVNVDREAAAALESREDWAGYFTVVEEGRIRQTALPETE